MECRRKKSARKCVANKRVREIVGAQTGRTAKIPLQVTFNQGPPSASIRVKYRADSHSRSFKVKEGWRARQFIRKPIGNKGQEFKVAN